MVILAALGGLTTAIGIGKTIYEGFSSYGRSKYENKQLKKWLQKGDEGIALVKENELKQKDLANRTRELERQNFDIQQQLSQAEALGGYGADTRISMNQALSAYRRERDIEANLEHESRMAKIYVKEDELRMGHERSERGFFSDFVDAFVL